MKTLFLLFAAILITAFVAAIEPKSALYVALPVMALACVLAFERGRNAFVHFVQALQYFCWTLVDRVRLAANVLYNEGTHEGGLITRLTDAAIATRYLFVEIGSDAAHVAVCNAGSDIPLGVCSDESTAAEQEVNVMHLGSAPGTLRVTAGATIAAGAMIVTNNVGKAITLPGTTGTYYIVGRALQDAVLDQTFEFDPCFPVQRVVP